MVFRLQALLLLLSFSLFAEEIVGRVVRVADGDTITVLSIDASGREAPIVSYPSPQRSYTPVQEARTLQSKTLLLSSLARLYTPVEQTPNSFCENYRKTYGYPCQKNEGDRCGKCGG